ncbi:MAG: sugar phosphate isomerase/epimerase family protein [Pseudomonadota bacterium]
MTPLKIGAALMIETVATHRDWLFADDRDLEIQDFALASTYSDGWQDAVDRAKAAIDGFGGRLGIHGPFYGLDIANPEPDLAKHVGAKYAQSVEAAAALGAQQMVIHSPFNNWHEYNRFNFVREGFSSLVSQVAADVEAVMGPALKLAEAHGVTLVVENIQDITPQIRREMVEIIGSPAMALSIDTGHAQIAQRASDAPPVDVYVRDAGHMLKHVHLQDTDGYADRHWAPGEGHIEWTEVFRALATLESAPHLVLELKRHEDIPAGFAYLKDLGVVV